MKKGWSIPTLPQHIIDFQSTLLIRVLRVLGGSSLLMILSIKYTMFGIFSVFLFIYLYVLSNIVCNLSFLYFLP